MRGMRGMGSELRRHHNYGHFGEPLDTKLDWTPRGQERRRGRGEVDKAGAHAERGGTQERVFQLSLK